MSFTYVPKQQRKTTIPAKIFNSKPIGTNSNIKEVNIPKSFLTKSNFMANYQPHLKNYILRCFSQCQNDIEREIISQKLYESICSSAQISNGNINSKNWSLEPLISLDNSNTTPQKLQSPKPLSMHQAFSSVFLKNVPPKVKTESLKQPTQISQISLRPTSGQNVESQDFFPTPQSSGYYSSKKVFDPVENQKFGSEHVQIGLKHVISSSNSFKPNQSKLWFQLIPTNPLPQNPISKQLNEKDSNSTLLNKDQQEKKRDKKKKKSKKQQEKHSPVNLSVSSTIKPPKLKKAPSVDKLSNISDFSLDELIALQYSKKDKSSNKGRHLIEKSSSLESFQPNIDFSQEAIHGTSTALEKQYLRLTGPPNPANVRPEPVLKKSLAYVIQKYKRSGDYSYIEEQLRTIRQDIVVQHIEDDFVVKVYEVAAQLAVENEDWNNLNQSQMMLEKLYKNGFGEPSNVAVIAGNRILYMIGVNDSDGLYAFLPELSNEVLQSEDVKYSLNVWKVVGSGNWSKYFELLKEAKEKNDEKNRVRAKLLEMKAKDMRYLALPSIVNGFKQLRLVDYQELMFFDTIEETTTFLKSTNVQIPSS